MGQKFLRNVLGSAFAVFALLAAQSAQAGPITFDFTGTQGGTKGAGTTFGNTRTFTAGDVTLWVTSWGYTDGASNDALEAASLGRWSVGLGSCNVEEIPCSDPEHQVDNIGADDWVLFVFSEPVDIQSVRIDPYGVWDRDVSYYVGNVALIPLDLTGINYSGLAGLGFGPLNGDTSTESGAYRDVSITGSWANALLLSGYQVDDQDDRFKIRSLNAIAVPETGSLAFFLTASCTLMALRWRRSTKASK